MLMRLSKNTFVRFYGPYTYIRNRYGNQDFMFKNSDCFFKHIGRIVREESEIISSIVSEFSDVDLLRRNKVDIDAVVDSRHYYSHFVPLKKKPKTLDGIELFKESRKIRILLMCCILSFRYRKQCCYFLFFLCFNSYCFSKVNLFVISI